MTDPDVTAMREALRAGLGVANIEAGRCRFRALDPDGQLWCQSSNPAEVAASARGVEGVTFERLPEYIVWTPWEPWTPEPDAAW